MASNKKVTLPRPTRVKNKSPAPIQITADQILREARQLHDEPTLFRPPPKRQKTADAEELADHRLRKRQDFERQVRSNPNALPKYAQWEESQNDLARARSVWERALDADHRHATVWLKYAGMEMRNRSLSRARNVWDRSVTLLPRADQLWYKYSHMEETLGNLAGARQVFERWMDWFPEQRGWVSYIDFELRYNEIDRARAIFERLVEQGHPRSARAWIRFARFEAENGETGRARAVYERAAERLGHDGDEAEELLMAFAGFEEKCNQIERAEAIYKFALDHKKHRELF